jgi:hypothetical protein
VRKKSLVFSIKVIRLPPICDLLVLLVYTGEVGIFGELSSLVEPTTTTTKAPRRQTDERHESQHSEYPIWPTSQISFVFWSLLLFHLWCCFGCVRKSLRRTAFSVVGFSWCYITWSAYLDVFNFQSKKQNSWLLLLLLLLLFFFFLEFYFRVFEDCWYYREHECASIAWVSSDFQEVFEDCLWFGMHDCCSIWVYLTVF